MKAVYHKKAKSLIIETKRITSNGIKNFRYCRSIPFNTEKEAEKHVNRYLKGHSYEVMDF